MNFLKTIYILIVPILFYSHSLFSEEQSQNCEKVTSQLNKIDPSESDESLSVVDLQLSFILPGTLVSWSVYLAGETFRPWVGILDHHTNFTTALIVSSPSFFAFSAPLYYSSLRKPLFARIACVLNSCFLIGAGILFELHHHQAVHPGVPIDVPDLLSATAGGLVAGAWGLTLVHDAAKPKPRFLLFGGIR